MRTEQLSGTALRAAHARAVHQVADTPCVFPDPLALRVIGADPATLTPGGMPPEVRLFLAVRHRMAEDALAAFVAGAGSAAGGRQSGQLVILGAGMDTFAYRNPHAGLRVFEVDRAATQTWKRARLADAGIAVPDSVVYVPIDLAEQSLGAWLAWVGFDPAAPTFFVWLGVVPYLTRDAVLTTLRFVAGLGRPSEIVFDYNRPPTAARERATVAALTETMAGRGEPWQSFFTSEEIRRELGDAGFGVVDDLGWRECMERYAVDSPMPIRFGGRVVRATTAPAG
jgi:methyltransferase (TIGR00027 family)